MTFSINTTEVIKKAEKRLHPLRRLTFHTTHTHIQPLFMTRLWLNLMPHRLKQHFVLVCISTMCNDNKEILNFISQNKQGFLQVKDP